MFYVKLFSLCIKGKTHFLGITPNGLWLQQVQWLPGWAGPEAAGECGNSCVDPTNSVCLVDAIEDSPR